MLNTLINSALKYQSREKGGAVVEDGGKDNIVITIVRQGIVKTLV